MKSLSRIRENLPAVPRFSDRAQRRAVGNIAKFMAGLLVLTLIARGTSGATLARVDLSSTSRSEIVEAVTGTATVSARDSLDITAPEGLTIMEMLTGAGQTVEVGDIVARFDIAEVREKLIRETVNLEKLMLDLDKLEKSDATDTAARDNARRSLGRAQDDYDSTKAQGEADISDARKALAELLAEEADAPDKAAVETAERNLLRAQEDFETSKKRDEADVAAAQSSLNSVVANRSDIADSTALDNATRSLTRAQQDRDVVKEQGEEAVNAAQDALDALDESATEAEKAAARAALEDAKKRADDNLQTATRRVEDAQGTLAQAESNYNSSYRQALTSRQTALDNARNALESAKKKAADNLLSSTRKIEDTEIALAQAKANLDKSAEQLATSRQTAVDNARNALEAAQKKASDNLLSALRRIEDAEVSMAAAERDYNRNTQQSADTAIQNSVSAISMRLDIAAKKEVVDKLNLLALNEGVLYADIAGVVLMAKAERSKTDQNYLIAFMDGAKGFEATMTITKANADKLAIGDECRVTTGGGSMYFTPTVIGTISAIAPPDEQDRSVVTIRLPESDWTEGQRVDAQAVQGRDTYDMCVPLSALRSDNTGYYVLSVEQKSTVLGVENVVIRLSVNVLASDEDNAAIQGPFGRNAQVITGSNKSVEAGDRVRIN